MYIFFIKQAQQIDGFAATERERERESITVFSFIASEIYGFYGSRGRNVIAACENYKKPIEYIAK